MAQKNIVLKFGGSCLKSSSEIQLAADIVQNYKEKGYGVVAVVSAMEGTTNRLLSLSHELTETPDRRELDMLLSAGERIAMSMLSIALIDKKIPAISFTGSQAGILTNDRHSGADIVDVKAFRVSEEIEKSKVVVLAGFQGVCPETKEVTTLGRGGTDTTAVAISSYINAEKCVLFKDVDSVYNFDPKLNKSAKAIKSISYENMLKLSQNGAKIIHDKAILWAKRHSVKIEVNDFHQAQKVGTLISDCSSDLISCANLIKSCLVFKCPSLEEFNQYLYQTNQNDLQIISFKDATHLLHGPEEALKYFIKIYKPDVCEIISDILSAIGSSFPIEPNPGYEKKETSDFHYLIAEKVKLEQVISRLH
ncbi:MAG: hypothetical protein AB8E15_08200 [Bdellovibrionales bacterium]